MAILSDMLVYLRKRAGLTQQELADKVNMKRSAIGMYETGRREPDLETLEVFADFYNVDMNTLTGKGVSSPSLIISSRKNMTIGENIKHLRVSHGLSQIELGKIAGVTDKAVSTWENGEKIPRMGAIERMAAYFGVTKSYIIDGDDLNTLWKGGKSLSILNDRIKQRRIAAGKTLLEIAAALNVKEATVQRYESGAIKNIKHETIVALAEILQCSPAYLMGWEDTLNSPASSSIALNFEETNLILKFRSFNDEGKEKILTYISDLDQIGVYKKCDESGMVSEEAKS